MKQRLTRGLLLSGLIAVPAAAAATGPFYVAGAIANASTDLDVEAGFQRLIEDDDEGWSLGVGFHISRYFAIEGVYHELGTAREATVCTPEVLCIAGLLVAPVQADSTAISVSVLPHWPVSESFSIYGRAGLSSWESDVNEAFGDLKLGSADDEDVLLGVGVRLAVAGPFGAFAEVSRLGDTFETVAIGATWGF